jgi:hypothetical protein
MLKGKKTYVVAIVGLVTAIGGWLTGDLSLADAIQAGLTAVLGATIRHGVATETKAVK